MRNFYKTIISSLLLLVAAMPTHAQKKGVVTGQVINMAGDALVGVTVMVEGSAVGTATDRKGEFSIVAKPNDRLTFSYLGYAEQTVPIQNQKRVVVTLKDDATVIEDIVVEVG